MINRKEMARSPLANANPKECDQNARDAVRDCFTCPVTFECLGDETLKVDGMCYDAHGLVGWFRSCIERSIQPTIPHSRRTLALADVDAFLAQYDAALHHSIASDLFRVYGYDNARDSHAVATTAIRRGHWDLLRYLIARKSAFLSEMQHHATHELPIWHVMAQYEPPADVVRGLFFWVHRVGANDRAHDEERSTPMHFAAAYNRVGLMRRLQARGGDVDAVDAARMTPIMWAVRAGYIASVRWLVRAGVSLERDDLRGDTVAHHACDNPELCDEDAERPPRQIALGLFFAQSPDLFFRRNRDGHTVLHLAVRNAMFHTVRWLVERVYRRDSRTPDAWIADVLRQTVDDLGKTPRPQADETDDALVEWYDRWIARHHTRITHE